MDAPQQDSSNRRFQEISAFLNRAGLSAPVIYTSDLDVGFMLIEDFGDNLFVRHDDKGSTLTLYKTAAEVLLHMRDLDPTPLALTRLTVDTLVDMIGPTFDWYATDISLEARAEIQARLLEVFSPLDKLKAAMSLRDYHSENLLWLPERGGVARVGLLDFQDAVLIHPAYDLVSLLQDARRDLEPDIVAATIEHYLKKSSDDGDKFRLCYALLGLQRNLRILGVFARLAVRDRKTSYLKFLPRVWQFVQENLAHPALSDLRRPFADVLPPPQVRIPQLLADAA